MGIGRKLPHELENPIDDILISIAELLNPYFHKLGATANFITLISSIFAALTVFAFHYDFYEYAALFYFIQYFFDCMDGNYARTYDQVTVFGDYFDHIKDILTNIIIFFMLYNKQNIDTTTKYTILIISVILLLTSFITLGCQQKQYNNDSYNDNNDVTNFDKFKKYYNNNNDITVLDEFKFLCHGNQRDILFYLKYFGTGTFSLFVSLSLLFLRYKKNIFTYHH